jgi:hypothetical protein
MGILNIFNNKIIKGEIGYFGLSEWWLSQFSSDERKYIIEILGDRSLVEGNFSCTDCTAISFLSGLANNFNNKKDRTIAYRILEKAESLVDNKTEALDKHFLFQAKLEVYYKSRDIDSNALDIAIKACLQQIEISPEAANAFKREYKDCRLPRHKGYEQLSIIREKEKDFNSAISLAKEANKQGWGGDWKKRIERCSKKSHNKV